jgi:hypothetical protein
MDYGTMYKSYLCGNEHTNVNSTQVVRITAARRVGSSDNARTLIAHDCHFAADVIDDAVNDVDSEMRTGV